MSRTSTTNQHLATLDDFIATVMPSGVKKAEEANTEKPSISGTTEHPSKNVDDRTQPAKEGERSAENTKDVKEDQGAVGVDSRAEPKTASASIFDFAARFASAPQKRAEGAAATPGSAADDQLQIGTNKQPTGEDPANETSSAKAGKKDEGDTTHPARTDNNELAGGKYASVNSVDEMMAIYKQAGDRFVASLANEAGKLSAPQAAPAAPVSKQASAPQTGDQIDPRLAAQVGYELAGLMTGKMDKRAADQMVFNELNTIVKIASDRANRVADWLDGYYSQLSQKRAEGDMPPEGAGAPGGPGGPGGPPPMAGPPGGAPMGGPPPGGAPGGDPSGGAGGELEHLVKMLEAQGIPPEQIMQLLQEAESAEGEGAGGPPGTGGPPGAAAGGPPPGAEAGGDGPPQGEPKMASAKPKITAKAAAAMIKEIVLRSQR